MGRKKKPTEIEPTGTCYCYLRVSTEHQADSGLGLDSQARLCVANARFRGLTFGDEHHDWESYLMRPGHFVDVSMSAYRTPFAKRPAGGKLLRVLKPGDTLIVSRLDRLCRSVSDFCHLSQDLDDMGVRLIIDKPQLDLTTANGRALLHILAAFAEWESRRKSERIIQALNAKRAIEAAEEFARSAGKILKKQDALDSNWRSVNERIAKLDDGQKPGRIFFYARCSHRESAKSGLGLYHQMQTTIEYGKLLQLRNPNLTIENQYTDVVVSAGTHPFSERPAGKVLHAEAKEGDVIVISCLDRGFRDIADTCVQVMDFFKRGVEVHFVDESINTSDSGGRVMLNMMAAFADYEKEMIGERIKESKAEAMSRGQYLGGNHPMFWKVYRFGGKKQLILDVDKVRSYRMIRYLIDRKWSVTDALERVEQWVAKKQGRPPIPPGGAAVRSTVWAETPKWYPRSKGGMIYPYWSERSFRKAARAYQRAIEEWYEQRLLRKPYLATEEDLDQIAARATPIVKPRGQHTSEA